MSDSDSDMDDEAALAAALAMSVGDAGNQHGTELTREDSIGSISSTGSNKRGRKDNATDSRSVSPRFEDADAIIATGEDVSREAPHGESENYNYEDLQKEKKRREGMNPHSNYPRAMSSSSRFQTQSTNESPARSELQLSGQSPVEEYDVRRVPPPIHELLLTSKSFITLGNHRYLFNVPGDGDCLFHSIIARYSGNDNGYSFATLVERDIIDFQEEPENINHETIVVGLREKIQEKILEFVRKIREIMRQANENISKIRNQNLIQQQELQDNIENMEEEIRKLKNSPKKVEEIVKKRNHVEELTNKIYQSWEDVENSINNEVSSQVTNLYREYFGIDTNPDDIVISLISYRNDLPEPSITNRLYNNSTLQLWERYANDMGNSNIWGEEIALYILSSILNVNFRVYSSTHENWFLINNSTENHGEIELYLNNSVTGKEHYNLHFEHGHNVPVNTLNNINNYLERNHVEDNFSAIVNVNKNEDNKDLIVVNKIKKVVNKIKKVENDDDNDDDDNDDYDNDDYDNDNDDNDDNDDDDDDDNDNDDDNDDENKYIIEYKSHFNTKVLTKTVHKSELIPRDYSLNSEDNNIDKILDNILRLQNSNNEFIDLPTDSDGESELFYDEDCYNHIERTSKFVDNQYKTTDFLPIDYPFHIGSSSDSTYFSPVKEVYSRQLPGTSHSNLSGVSGASESSISDITEYSVKSIININPTPVSAGDKELRGKKIRAQANTILTVLEEDNELDEEKKSYNEINNKQQNEEQEQKAQLDLMEQIGKTDQQDRRRSQRIYELKENLMKIQEQTKNDEEKNVTPARKKIIEKSMRKAVKDTFRKTDSNNRSITDNIHDINNDGFIRDFPQAYQNEEKGILKRFLSEAKGYFPISVPPRRPPNASASVDTNMSFATLARDILDKVVDDSKFSIEGVADIERNTKLAALLDSIVNHKIDDTYGMSDTEKEDEKEQKEALLEIYIQNEIALNEMPTDNEETKKLRIELEEDLIEKYNNFITRTKYGGADLRDYVSNFQDNITQFKKVWGTKLNTKCKSQTKSVVSLCYLCQKGFHGKAPGYSVEMEHKLPLTLFNQLVPSFTFFPVQMLYWNKFIKLKHKIPDFDDETPMNRYTFHPTNSSEPFIEYIYRFINCQDASKDGWCECVNQLLNLFVFEMFDNFMRTSLENNKNPQQNTIKKIFENPGSTRTKHILFLHTMKLSMFEFAYSHVYCNQMKIAGDFRVSGIRNGFLQKCFFCCDQDGNLTQPLKTGLYSQLKNIPENPIINEKVDRAKLPENTRELTDRNGSNGSITFSEETVSRNEWHNVFAAFGDGPFTEENGIMPTEKFEELSKHLKVHFDCFNEMYEQMSNTKNDDNYPFPLTNRQIMAYNILKSSLAVNSQLIRGRLNELKSDKFKKGIRKKLKSTAKKGGKKIKSNKKTRKKIII